ncbi:MAG: hypothetical protein IIA59_02100 [Candidatus Marinimicrobia bacterium]|nr:hypothetical protein [Candidatus Neomarinimicrobiota bacterium]
MMLRQEKLTLGVIIISLVFSACFPSKRVTLLKREVITPGLRIKSPTKAFLMDASFLLFPYGFSVVNDTIRGVGTRYWLDHADLESKPYTIPLDSIGAMSYYDLKSSPGSLLGSTLLGLYGGFITAYSIECITCPKCCFGSCPTLYTHDGKEYKLEAELFSYSLSKFFQENDLDRLSQKIPQNGLYQVRVSNEALETHYINELSLITVSHQIGTKLFPSDKGGFIATTTLQPPIEAVNSLGEDVFNLLHSRDDRWYRSDTNMVRKLAEGVYSDWVDLKLKLPEKATNVKLVLHLRNTLLSTILLYDVVLASQGIAALEWTERMNKDLLYASQYHAIYNSYSGMDIKVYRNGKWIQQASLKDVGPIAGKDVAVELAASKDAEGIMRVRLEFFPDNIMIDYVAFEANNSLKEALLVDKILPTEIYDHTGQKRDDILELIEKSDNQFLITSPGESYYFNYNIPPSERMEKTVFVQSKGYYTEWIRGEWLMPRSAGYQFDLLRVDETIAQLRQSWLANRGLIESEFFKTKIPLGEGL